MTSKPKVESLDTIVSLSKRRGFIFPSSEIYGGFASCYDYGPMGVELKRNVKDAWWNKMVTMRDDVVGLDCSIIMHPKVWEASGHVANFTDPLIECSHCKLRVREDHLEFLDQKCTSKNKEHSWGEPRQFNLMFKTNLGPVESSSNTVYLRPETAQGMFVNFQNVVDSSRVKIPFGIAQQGKSFRNEVSTRRFTFRTAEFEQMEMEYFCREEEGEELFKYWRENRLNWFKDLGVSQSRLRLRDHKPDELAHYSRCCSDIEYLFPFGWSELEGIAWRGSYDLTKHSENSNKNLVWRDQASGETFTPNVIEPALGTDRAILTFLTDAYEEDEINGNKRTVLKLHPALSPIKVAVFPLLRKDSHPEKSREVYKMIKSSYAATYDESGNIGKRYRRQDEIGTPICVTIDHQTFDDDTITVRDRDTLEQQRVKIDALKGFLFEKFKF